MRLRETVPPIEQGTVMQKIINPCQLEEYLYKGKTNVTGWASKATDISPFACSLDEGVRNARLDYFIPNRALSGTYDGNDFLKAVDNGEDMYVIRYKTNETPDLDQYAKLDGYNKPPCTGTGILGSNEHLIPEYSNRFVPGTGTKTFTPNGKEIADGAIYKINSDGSECMIGYWDKNVGHFVAVE